MPSNGAHIVLGQIIDPLAFQVDRAARDPPPAGQQTDNSRARHRLARPGLADHTQNLAACDIERYCVECGQRSPTGWELDRQIANGQERIGCHGRLLRLLHGFGKPLCDALLRRLHLRANPGEARLHEGARLGGERQTLGGLIKRRDRFDLFQREDFGH